MTQRTKALLMLMLVSMLWGSAGTTGKLLLREASPFVITFWRFATAALVVLPFVLQIKKPKKWILHLLPLGLFNAANVLFYYSGLTRTTANTGSLLGASVPLLTAFFSWILIRETVSSRKLIGITLGLIGAVLIVLVPVLEHGRAIGTDLLGNLLMVGSAIAWTFYIISSRFSSSRDSFNPILATFINFTVCALAAGAFSIFTGLSFEVPAFASPSYLGLFAYVVLGVTVLTFFLFQWAVQHVSATTASLKEYLQLVVGVSINAVVLGERFTPVFFIGSALILTGVLVATGSQISKKIIALTQSRNA